VTAGGGREAKRHRIVRGVPVPAFLYGTAWKEDRTEDLARLALATGFRGIDTANQRRHYVEAAVGAAVAAALAEGTLTREDVFLQTKFTSIDGQDRRLPYDASADAATQVHQSFLSSIEHLRTAYVDSYVLHGPSSSRRITDEDWTVWRAMESHDRVFRMNLLPAMPICRSRSGPRSMAAEIASATDPELGDSMGMPQAPCWMSSAKPPAAVARMGRRCDSARTATPLSEKNSV